MVKGISRAVVKFRGVMADRFAASRLATFMAAAAKCTAGEVVGANDGYYYYEPSHFRSAAACSCYPVFVTVARIVIVFVLVVAVAYYYGKYVGKAQRNTTGREVVKEKKYDDYDGSWQKISLEVSCSRNRWCTASRRCATSRVRAKSPASVNSFRLGSYRRPSATARSRSLRGRR